MRTVFARTIVILLIAHVTTKFFSIAFQHGAEFQPTPDAYVHTAIHEILELIRYSQNNRSRDQNSIFTKRLQNGDRRPRPYITLSFAQSLDAKLAPFLVKQNYHSILSSMVSNSDVHDNDVGRKHTSTFCSASNFAISGPETLQMTHAIRSIHDGILIGGRTLSIDNPRLTNRLWRPVNNISVTDTVDTRHDDSSSIQQHQPRPIVLDPNLRHVMSFLIDRNKPYSKRLRAQRLLVFCSKNCSLLQTHKNYMEENWSNITIIPCTPLENGSLDLDEVLAILMEKYDINSLMVEGGATVLASFLENDLFDSICVTISPLCWIGSGLEIKTTTHPDNKERVIRCYRPVYTKQLGDDIVVLLSVA